MSLKGSSVDSVKVAKTAAATSFEDESVKAAGDNTRRRIAAANSRDNAASFWTSLIGTKGAGTNSKGTLG